MKKLISIVLVLVSFILFLGCASLTGKDWKLLEVHVESELVNRKITYDRNELRAQNIPDTYTINFTRDTVSGVGAPNRYSAPYTRDKQNLRINAVRATQMATLIQPEKLQEHVFFGYVQRATSWSIENKNLVLKTKTEDGAEVRMIFSP